MVAITVILAAVIAAFVLDIGDSMGGEANAGINIDVDDSDGTVEVSVATMGNAEEIEIRGESINDAGDPLTETGERTVLDVDDGDIDAEGTVAIVAITEAGDETEVASEDFEFAPNVEFNVGEDYVEVTPTTFGDADTIKLVDSNSGDGETLSDSESDAGVVVTLDAGVEIEDNVEGTVTAEDGDGDVIATVDYDFTN